MYDFVILKGSEEYVSGLSFDQAMRKLMTLAATPDATWVSQCGTVRVRMNSGTSYQLFRFDAGLRKLVSPF